MTRECARTWWSMLVGILLASCLGCSGGVGGGEDFSNLSDLSGTQLTTDFSDTGPFPRDVGEIKIRNDYDESVEVSFTVDPELVRPDPVTLGPGETAVITVQANEYFAGERELNYTVTADTGAVIGGGQIAVLNGGTAGTKDVFFDSDGEIWRVPLDGPPAAATPIVQTSGELNGPGVSPAGPVVFSSIDGTTGDVPLWRSNPDGTGLGVERSVTDHWLQFPAFLTATVYAWSQGNGFDDGDIWYFDSMALPAEQLKQLTGTESTSDGDGFNDYDASFGKVGGADVIFFSRHDATNTTSDIYRISLTGADLTPVAADPSLTEDHPSYSEANDLIVFEQAADGLSKDDIWVMNPDGTGRVQVTNDSFDNDDPVWSPDGEWIVWEQSPEGGITNRIVKIAWPLQAGAVPIYVTEPGLDARRPAMTPR